MGSPNYKQQFDVAAASIAIRNYASGAPSVEIQGIGGPQTTADPSADVAMQPETLGM